MRIAVVGSGISGLAASHILGPHHEIVLYEASERLGGHTNTIAVEDPELGEIGVDTGFIVHNDRNYPNLLKLFAELDVKTQDSEMSFSVTDDKTKICYRATNLKTLLANPRNVSKGRFWQMLVDIPRFYRNANKFLLSPKANYTTRKFIADGKYSKAFVDLHLIPLGAAVWSANPDTFMDFPAASLFRFLANHGLLGIGDRPQWRTVTGGSVQYIKKLLGQFSGQVRLNSAVDQINIGDTGVEISSNGAKENFDKAIVAVHSDQALKILKNSTGDAGRTHMLSNAIEILSAIRYETNQATLHTDTTIMPPYRRAWAAWNYKRTSEASNAGAKATLTYDMNALQRFECSTRYLVSLNSSQEIDESKIISTANYSHPIFDLPAITAQERIDDLSAGSDIYFCGAWRGFGFHEDGIRSAVEVCHKLGVKW